MIRKCEIVRSGIRKDIYIDSINKKEILEYLNLDERHKSKFRIISEIVATGLYNKKLYRREDINKRCKDVYSMRFFVSQENDRIYCKEITDRNSTRVVIMSILHLNKKSEKLSSKEISQIEKIGGYTYEI